MQRFTLEQIVQGNNRKAQVLEEVRDGLFHARRRDSVPTTSDGDENISVQVVVEPEVQGWVMEQSAPSVEVQGDVVVGSTLPESVQVIAVPKHKKYAFAVINKHRVLVEPETRKIIKVY